MSQVSVTLIKELREKSGAGMMDCKTALTESAGDIDSAVDWLRKKGLAAAAKKAGRVATEGLVAVATDGTRGAVVELNSETDFVARNPDFQEFVRQLSEIALTSGGDSQATAAAAMQDGQTVSDALTKMIGSIGENLTFRRSTGLTVRDGLVASYVHNSVAPGLGRIGVLVALESKGDRNRLEDLGKKLAMHIAAASPQWLSREDIEAEDLERERSVLEEQARASGRPDEIIAKMVEGRLRKFYSEVCLLDQTYAIDGESRVDRVIKDAAAELGETIAITGFARFQLGQGIEKKETDFAAEVAAVASR